MNTEEAKGAKQSFGGLPMEIRCESCNSKLNVPDEKIPQDRRVSISCPKCKEKLTLEHNGPDLGEASSPVKGAGGAPKMAKTGAVQAYEAEGGSLESYSGTKLALVAENDPAQSEKIRQALEALGYRYVAAESISQAISQIRFHIFDLVILSDPFDGIELGQSPVLQFLNRLSMSVRRKMFVVLIGKEFNTMDQMTAFVMSSNLVVNRRDLDKFADIIKSGVSDNEKFYKVFMDTLVEVGKA